MAKNDLILLDALIDQKCEESPGEERGEVFEKFVLEQLLKSFDLSEDDLLVGWTDGHLDGGIDGFYTFVNGHLVIEPKGHQWPRSNVEIDVFLVTCKHHETFQQGVLDALLASFQELFDLAKPNAELAGSYSGEIMRARDSFSAAFRHLAILNPSLRFRVIYASRGDSQKLGRSVAARGKQLQSLLSGYFSASSISFQVIGASELVEMNRQVKSFALSLPFMEHLTADQDGYVVLAKLKDYCAFVTDEQGALRRYLFDSNVRDFLGVNVINAGITSTLRDASAPSFWWLNNGVTILSTNATVVGKQLQLRDIQIVNGLQTTESLYRHFVGDGRTENADKQLLIKVIVSEDDGVRDQVIRATNSQSSVEPTALHSTDKIQRDIESILEPRDWYYERRTNYFRNAGKPQSRIITPHFIASGVMALIFKDPVSSARFKQRRLRSPGVYESVFATYFPIDVWPAIADQLKRGESVLTGAITPTTFARMRMFATWRGLLAFMAVSKHFGTFDYTINQLAALKAADVSPSVYADCYRLISPWMKERRGKMNGQDVEQILDDMAVKLGVSGDPRRVRRRLPGAFRDSSVNPEDLTDELLARVDSALPDQPWKPRVHLLVADALGISSVLVQAATRKLIASGKRFRQVDGRVFDSGGNVIMVDPERVSEDH